jgi:hypothetical protein
LERIIGFNNYLYVLCPARFVSNGEDPYPALAKKLSFQRLDVKHINLVHFGKILMDFRIIEL